MICLTSGVDEKNASSVWGCSIFEFAQYEAIPAQFSLKVKIV